MKLFSRYSLFIFAVVMGIIASTGNAKADGPLPWLQPKFEIIDGEPGHQFVINDPRCIGHFSPCVYEFSPPPPDVPPPYVVSEPATYALLVPAVVVVWSRKKKQKQPAKHDRPHAPLAPASVNTA